MNENAGFGVTAGSQVSHFLTFGFCPGPSRALRPALRFAGRVGGRTLRPGRYVLVATPLAGDGRAGKALSVRFRIAR